MIIYTIGALLLLVIVVMAHLAQRIRNEKNSG